MTEGQAEKRNTILQRLQAKSSMKYSVYEQTLNAFTMFRDQAQSSISAISASMREKDPRIRVEFKETSDFEFSFSVAADLLIVSMHTNVFEFPREHEVHRTAYVKEDSDRSFCGVIHIYNFLHDSFKYNRYMDVGYLIGRVFVNKENHYFVEGKRQVGFLYNDFQRNILDHNAVQDVLDAAMLYALDFDLLCPPYDNIKEATVQQIQMVGSAMSLKTGKRLGFRFQADHDKGRR
jgi:hypothetical protein